MLEKRKHKRLKMEHALELARLNADGTADGGVVNADILNISRGGVGFLSRKRLEVGSYYDTRISLFSREMIDAVLEIVHVEEQEKGYYYGGEFIGISDSDAVKISRHLTVKIDKKTRLIVCIIYEMTIKWCHTIDNGDH